MKKLIFRKGQITTLYEECPILEVTKAISKKMKIWRASYVEAPQGDLETISFTVDLTPCGGSIVSGFSSYKQAVDFERDWINKNYIKTL